MTTNQKQSLEGLYKANGSMGNIVTSFIEISENLISEYLNDLIPNIEGVKFEFINKDKKLFSILIEDRYYSINITMSIKRSCKIGYSLKPILVATLEPMIKDITAEATIGLCKMLEKVASTIYELWQKESDKIDAACRVLSDNIVNHATINDQVVGALYNAKVGYVMWSIVEGEEAVGDASEMKEYHVSDSENLFNQVAIPREYVVEEIKPSSVTITHYTYPKYVQGVNNKELNEFKVKTGQVKLKKREVIGYLIEEGAAFTNVADAFASYTAMEQANSLLKFSNVIE